MARDTTTRLTLTGSLDCRTPVHVGGFGDDVDTDLPLARDGLHRPYIPGTSLAGPLRHWCERAFGRAAVDAVWGYQEGDGGHASFVTVDDLRLPDDKLVPEVRDGVGIDRRTGAAAEHIKYDRAVLPRGTVLPDFTLVADVPIRLRSDGGSEAYRAAAGDLLTVAKSMLAALRNALAAGRVRFGAGKTRGLGKVVLTDARLRRVDTSTRNGIFQLLRGAAEEWAADDYAGLRPSTETPRLDVTIGWSPDGPLMVKAGYDGIAADILPLVSGTAGGVAPVVPGASVKGVLRSRAEQIIRTVLGTDLEMIDDAKRRFLADTRVPLVDELFGSRGDPEADAALGLGALAVDDCYATTPLAAADWQRIAGAADETGLRTGLDRTAAKGWQQAFHVAVDRWTGGAAEGMLYTVLEPHAVGWETITMTVDLTRVSDASVALLMLVLRDFAAGRLPLGWGTNRGMGAVKGVTVTVTPHAADDRFGPAPFTLAAPPAAVREAWTKWLDASPAVEVRR